MPLFRDMTGQGVYLFAHDSGGAKAGDSANITGSYSLDGTDHSGFATANPTEMGGGVYWQPLAQAETDANRLAYRWASSTSGVVIDPVFESTGVQLSDAVAHGGAPGSSTATLALAQIHLEAGSEMVALNVIGSGNSDAIYVDGFDATALHIVNSSTGTAVVLVQADSDSNAVQFATEGSGTALSLVAFGDGNALAVQAVGDGRAALIRALGVNAAVDISAVDGDGIGTPTMRVRNTGTGPAVQLGDGSGGAQGLLVLAPGNTHTVQFGDGSNGGISLLCLSSSGDAVQFATNGSGSGLSLIGDGLTADLILGGGGGLNVSGPVNISSSGDAPGVLITGSGTGAAVQLGDGDSGAEALLALAGTGNTDAAGIKAVGAGTGSGFDGTLSPATLAGFITVNTTKVAADIAAGSVVYLSRHSIAGIGF